MVRRSPGFREAFGVCVGANAIHQERTSSRFAPVSSDAKALDGLNVQVAVCDEIASHKTAEVYDVLLTAMGSRLARPRMPFRTMLGGPGARPSPRALRPGPRRPDRVNAAEKPKSTDIPRMPGAYGAGSAHRDLCGNPNRAQRVEKAWGYAAARRSGS